MMEATNNIVAQRAYERVWLKFKTQSEAAGLYRWLPVTSILLCLGFVGVPSLPILAAYIGAAALMYANFNYQSSRRSLALQKAEYVKNRFAGGGIYGTPEHIWSAVDPILDKELGR
ncbi:MAG: hypothetical protein AAB573_03390 [Patescibacteria group bacterium]